MSFFRKKKKTPPKEMSKAILTPREQPISAQTEDDTQLSTSNGSDTTPTVVKEPTSIFGGMVLSSNVRKQESQNSPYLSRSDMGGDGNSERLGDSGAGEDEGKSAFGFISHGPPSSIKAGGDEKEEESGFSFLHLAPGGSGGDVEGSSEDVDTTHKSQDTPPLLVDSTPSTVSSQIGQLERKQELSSPQPTFQAVRNSSGAISPVPGPISPPLISHPSSATSTINQSHDVMRTPVGKQQPSANKKKKKRRVVRPGLERVDDSILVDTPTLSESVNKTSIESDSVSLTSQTSSVDTGTTGDTNQVTTETVPSNAASLASDVHPPSDGIPVSRKQDTGEEDDKLKVDIIASDISVDEAQQDDMTSELLIDTSNDTHSHMEEEERETSIVFQDQQLLAEVFTGDAGGVIKKEESGEMRGCERVEEVDKGIGDIKSGNYNVELTSSDQLTLLIQSSESNLARIRLDLNALHTRRQSSLDQQISEAKQQRQNREQMKELRARETKALSEEDYELAEELQGQLESVSQDSSWSISTASHSLLLEWVQEVCELIQTEQSIQSDIRTQLAEMRETQSQALSSAEERIATTHTKHKMKLKTLEDKIERERGHIALDKEHLNKREQQLEDEIACRAERFISKKSTLQDELQTVHNEIAELEMKLCELRKEEVRLQTAISEEEGKIKAVHLELDSENSSLREERESLSRKEHELQSQQTGVEELRQQYEIDQQEERTQKQSISDVLGRVDIKWADSEHRTHTLVQCLSSASDLESIDIATLLSPSQQLQRCRETVLERESKVKELAGQVLSVQDFISQLRRQITSAEERLPQLEEAKKTAVAARQYKEAGRVSSELKQLKTELEPQRKQLGEKESEVTGLNQKLASLTSELARERGELELLEKKEDLEHLRRLAASLAKLQATKTSIPDTSSPLDQVLGCWNQLYQLLADGLCAKHDLELADFTPHIDTQPEDEMEVMDTVMRDSNVSDDGNELSQISRNQKPPEERTPGVGMEVEAESEGERGEGRGSDSDRVSLEVEELKKKITELESRIGEAVSDEVEDYELAAKLDKELHILKETLTSIIAN